MAQSAVSTVLLISKRLLYRISTFVLHAIALLRSRLLILKKTDFSVRAMLLERGKAAEFG